VAVHSRSCPRSRHAGRSNRHSRRPFARKTIPLRYGRWVRSRSRISVRGCTPGSARRGRKGRTSSRLSWVGARSIKRLCHQRRGRASANGNDHRDSGEGGGGTHFDGPRSWRPPRTILATGEPTRRAVALPMPRRRHDVAASGRAVVELNTWRSDDIGSGAVKPNTYGEVPMISPF